MSSHTPVRSFHTALTRNETAQRKGPPEKRPLAQGKLVQDLLLLVSDLSHQLNRKRRWELGEIHASHFDSASGGVCEPARAAVNEREFVHEDRIRPGASFSGSQYKNSLHATLAGRAA